MTMSQSAVEALVSLNVQMIKIPEYKKRTIFTLKYDRLAGITYKHRKDGDYVVMKPHACLPISNRKAVTNITGKATYVRNEGEFKSGDSINPESGMYGDRTFTSHDCFQYVNPFEVKCGVNTFVPFDDIYPNWYPQIDECYIPQFIELFLKFKGAEAYSAKCQRKIAESKKAPKDESSIPKEPKPERTTVKIIKPYIQWGFIVPKPESLSKTHWKEHDPMGEYISSKSTESLIYNNLSDIIRPVFPDHLAMNIRAFELGVIEHAFKHNYFLEKKPEGTTIDHAIVDLLRPSIIPTWVSSIEYVEAKEASYLEPDEVEKLDLEGAIVSENEITYSLLRI